MFKSLLNSDFIRNFPTLSKFREKEEMMKGKGHSRGNLNKMNHKSKGKRRTFNFEDSQTDFLTIAS